MNQSMSDYCTDSCKEMEATGGASSITNRMHCAPSPALAPLNAVTMAIGHIASRNAVELPRAGTVGRPLSMVLR
jgi:hypothetical protein